MLRYSILFVLLLRSVFESILFYCALDPGKLDAQMIESCKLDIPKFCGGVKDPKHGSLMKCLKNNIQVGVFCYLYIDCLCVCLFVHHNITLKRV